jgi:MraZ protein
VVENGLKLLEFGVKGFSQVYFGEAQTVLDDKGRITVPSLFRKKMDVNNHLVWYMTRGYDKSIFMFHQEPWNKIREQASKYSAMNARALDFRRLFFGSVAEARPDNQWRIAVPQHLRDHAGLKKEAVLIGVDDHLELWDRDAWMAFQREREAEFKEMASSLFSGEDRLLAPTVEGGTFYES